MAQYHYLVNLDKKQVIYPPHIGNIPSLKKQVGWDYSTATALVMLLAGSSRNGGRGTGDFRCGHPLIGSWAGDRIAFIGDYAEPEDIPTCDARLTYQQFAAVIRGSDVIEFQAPAGWSEWSNISAQVREMMTAEYGITYFGDDWLEIDPPPGELDR